MGDKRTDVRPFTSAELESLCKGLADTVDGLTGSEIGRMLEQARIKDSDPGMTKWKRLYNALAASQHSGASGKPVLNFIHHSLAPARYVGQPLVLEHRRSVVNVALAFFGLRFEENGKFTRIVAVSTLNEAEERASRLRGILHVRGVHSDVLRFCRAELKRAR